MIGAGDVLQQLRVPKNDASREMISSLVHGSVNVSRVRGAFRSASPEARAALVEQTLI